MIEADIEIAEVFSALSHDLVKSVDMDTDAVVRTEVVKLDGHNRR